jgi:uncharacterized protein YeaO (DUF488 family)
MVKIKRAYESAAPTDGYRVLVDRLWPRGIKKSELDMDEWAKDLAPSNELRKSFGHDPDRWREFVTRYRNELRDGDLKSRIEALAKRAQHRNLTLIYAARDEEHNNAIVLRDLIVKASQVLNSRLTTRERKAA